MKVLIKRVSYETRTGAALAAVTVIAIGSLLNAAFNAQVIV